MSSPTTIIYGDYYRLLNNLLMDTEEIRYDKPTIWTGTFEYIGIAPQGSLTSDSVWSCVRRTWNNGRCTRDQFRTNVSWDNRTQGWT